MANLAGPPPGPRAKTYPPVSHWIGWIAFAGTVTVVLGAFHLFQGLVFLLAPDLVGGEGRGAVVHLDLALSGWIQLAGGCLLIVAGLGVFGGYLWARSVVVVLAVSSLVTNFALFGTAPLWSLIVVALDLVVILAVTIHGSDVTP